MNDRCTARNFVYLQFLSGLGIVGFGFLLGLQHSTPYSGPYVILPWLPLSYYPRSLLSMGLMIVGVVLTFWFRKKQNEAEAKSG